LAFYSLQQVEITLKKRNFVLLGLENLPSPCTATNLLHNSHVNGNRPQKKSLDRHQPYSYDDIIMCSKNDSQGKGMGDGHEFIIYPGR